MTAQRDMKDEPSHCLRINTIISILLWGGRIDRTFNEMENTPDDSDDNDNGDDDADDNCTATAISQAAISGFVSFEYFAEWLNMGLYGGGCSNHAQLDFDADCEPCFCSRD